MNEEEPLKDSEIDSKLFKITTSKLTVRLNDSTEDIENIDDFVASKSAKDLDWHSVTTELASLTRTAEATELAETLEPLPNISYARRRFSEVGEVLQLLEAEQVPPISGLKDLRESLSRAAIGAYLSATEMAAISRNCDIAARIKNFFSRNQEYCQSLTAVANLIDTCDELRAALTHAIEPGGRISDYASPDLKNLRRAVQTQTQRLRDKVDSLLQDEDFEAHLQDDYYTLREGRYVIPVRVGSKKTIAGIIHGYSQSGQTAFIEPEVLVQLNNGLRWAQIAVDEEEDRILSRLSSLVTASLESIESNIATVAYLDLTVAIARFSLLFAGTIPTLLEPPSETTEEYKGVDIKELRHPILHIKLGKDLEADDENTNVSNDLRIAGKHRVLVVSGPNTGGKTVILKAFGLAVLFAKCGIPVPAKSASIPFYGAVYTDIGDEQSIQKDLSTFSSHLINIGHFLPRCGPKTLVLLDELFTGTDPMQGSALAAALLEELAARGSTTMVTTHLESLKTIALHNDIFANASMGFDLESLQPNYLLTLGVPGSSFALRIANRLGFPETIVDNARQKLDQKGQLGVDDAMAKLEKQADELRAEMNRLQHQRQRTEQAERRYRKKYEDLSRKDRKLVNQRAIELQEQLKAADLVLRNKIKELQVDSNLHRQDLEHIRETIRIQDKVIERVKAQTAKEVVRPDGLVPVRFDELTEGMELYALNFKRNGTVTLVDEGRGRVQLQIGVMKSFVDVEDLFYTNDAARENARIAKDARSPHDFREQSSETTGEDGERKLVDVLLPQSTENTVDLRGMRQDDAVEKVDLFVAAAAHNGYDGIYIIHGFGSGVLRGAVRDYLSKSRLVRKFRPGGRGEGGDGVTIAFVGLRDVEE